MIGSSGLSSLHLFFLYIIQLGPVIMETWCILTLLCRTPCNESRHPVMFNMIEYWIVFIHLLLNEVKTEVVHCDPPESISMQTWPNFILGSSPCQKPWINFWHHAFFTPTTRLLCTWVSVSFYSCCKFFGQFQKFRILTPCLLPSSGSLPVHSSFRVLLFDF